MSITFVNPILYLCRCYYQHCNLLVINILNVHYFFKLLLNKQPPVSDQTTGADKSAAAIRADISWYLVLKLGGECDRKSLSADQIVGRCIICQVKCCNDQTCKPCLTMFRMESTLILKSVSCRLVQNCNIRYLVDICYNQNCLVSCVDKQPNIK